MSAVNSYQQETHQEMR